jgi:hypothetical protein
MNGRRSHATTSFPSTRINQTACSHTLESAKRPVRFGQTPQRKTAAFFILAKKDIYTRASSSLRFAKSCTVGKAESADDAADGLHTLVGHV